MLILFRKPSIDVNLPNTTGTPLYDVCVCDCVCVGFLPANPDYARYVSRDFWRRFLETLRNVSWFPCWRDRQSETKRTTLKQLKEDLFLEQFPKIFTKFTSIYTISRGMNIHRSQRIPENPSRPERWHRCRRWRRCGSCALVAWQERKSMEIRPFHQKKNMDLSNKNKDLVNKW